MKNFNYRSKEENFLISDSKSIPLVGGENSLGDEIFSAHSNWVEIKSSGLWRQSSNRYIVNEKHSYTSALS